MEVTDDEVKKVMKSRFTDALNRLDSTKGVILLVGEKPGMTYAYYRMSAREHLHAARLMVMHAKRILEEKDLMGDPDTEAVFAQAEVAIAEAQKYTPSELKREEPDREG